MGEPKIARRRFLALGGGTAVGALVGGIPVLRSALAARADPAVPLPAASTAQAAPPPGSSLFRLVATDGFMSYPGRRTPPEYPDDPGAGGNGVYSFGFRAPDPADLGGADPFTYPVGSLVPLYKGRVQHPAPILAVDESTEVPGEAPIFLKMSNLGFQMRPDLDDAHTIHWHGFRQQIPVMDGVPEASVSVPPVRDFPYYFVARDEGTYIYHCHFEDTEHVQMGMDGIIFVNPAQNGNTSLYPSGTYAYNDGDGSTGYDRQFTLLLNEVDVRPHDQLVAVQEFVWSEYRPQYFLINGRAYPDTILPNGTWAPGEGLSADVGEAHAQPVSSLVQANAGEHVLLRISNLGYLHHSMQLAGIPMRVAGADATLLRGPTGADLSFVTNTVDCGPGEARDGVFTAPAHSGGSGPDVYVFKSRNLDRLVNGPQGNLAPNGLGGMATEVHVYPSGALPPQTVPNGLVSA
jgi:FtsP/CotA-like multicopper oxidase with cupredoxin domain